MKEREGGREREREGERKRGSEFEQRAKKRECKGELFLFSFLILGNMCEKLYINNGLAYSTFFLSA